MPGIYVMAALTTAVVGLLVFLIFRKQPRDVQRLALAAILAQLPMSFTAYYAWRYPVLIAMEKAIGSTAIFGWLVALMAPLTEEPAKLWPLLLPSFRRSIGATNAVPVAVALGVGFGLGEIWFLAWRIVIFDPKTATLPWTMLGGFFVERLLICFVHGALTSRTLMRLHDKPFLGFATSVLFHFTLNAPIFLQDYIAPALRPLFLGGTTGLWEIALLLMLAIAWFGGDEPARRAILGTASCPECHHPYTRPWLAANLGIKRFEPCPHRHHWHVVG